MRLLRALLCVSLTTGALLAPTSSAHAQTVPGKEVAKKLFEDGVELEKKGEYADALGKYREAEQITVTPGLRFHKGYCLEMMGKLTAAVDEYEAADKLARDANKPEVHTAVIARLDPVRTRVPQIAIRLAVPAKDAEVQLDGKQVGAPLLDGKAFRIDPGEHAVTARATGYRNFVRRVQVPEGMTTTVEVVLDRSPTPAAVPPPPGRPATDPPAAPRADAGGPAHGAPPGTPPNEPPAEGAPHRSLVMPIVTTVGTVALAVTGVAFFVVAGNAQTDAQATCAQKTACDAEQSNVRTLDAVALGGFIGAAGLGILSAVLWTSRGGDRTAALFAKPGYAGGSVGLEGAF